MIISFTVFKYEMYTCDREPTLHKGKFSIMLIMKFVRNVFSNNRLYRKTIYFPFFIFLNNLSKIQLTLDSTNLINQKESKFRKFFHCFIRLIGIKCNCIINRESIYPIKYLNMLIIDASKIKKVICLLDFQHAIKRDFETKLIMYDRLNEYVRLFNRKLHTLLSLA